GNLLSRTVAMVEKYFAGKVPCYEGQVTKYDDQLEKDMIDTKKIYEQKMDKFYVNEAIREVFNLLSKANKYIDDTEPWALAKDSNRKDELSSVLNHLVLVLKESTIMLSCFLVETSYKALEQLGITNDSYSNILDFKSVDNVKVHKKDNLFPRLDPKIEIEYLNSK
ncbi:MAG: methionine--tRNA ligase, partial [Bacilli bacterium]|nr:methionine--tRNA ligase [Bacilli bacterium]